MIVNIKYFGMLSDDLEKKSESLTLEGPQTTLNAFRAIIQARHPKLLDRMYHIAVNQELANDDLVINDQDELALLPPYAGG